MKLFSVIAAAGVAVSAGVAAQAQTLATQTITSGLTRVCWAGSPDGDNVRLFVIEQRLNRASTSDPFAARIRWVNLTTNTLSPSGAPYLTVSDVAGINGMNVGEQGLLGMAFHPQFMSNGYFYTYRTRGSDGAVLIERYRANAPYATSTTADAASVQTVLEISHPTHRNHNGGWIDFGADGMLYMAVGDGGSGNDPGPGIGNAQSRTTLLGKVLRIDVDGADNIPGNADDADPVAGTNYRIPAGNPFSSPNRPEIWAYGLRNPWRCSFDRLTGNLWIGDVGQDNREEINVALGNPAGLNYGWKCTEGFRCTGLSNCPTCPGVPAGITYPIADYANTGTTAVPPFTDVAPGFNGIAVTGGYVYRGCDIPWFRGHYLFTDYGTPTLISFTYSQAGGIANMVNRTGELDPPGSASINNVVSFAEDARGEVYIVDATGGEIFKIVPSSPIPDCTVSGCGPQDFNGDGDSGTDQDIEAFFACLGGNCCPTCWPGGADFNGDGDVGTDQDIEAFFRVLGGAAC